MSDKTTVVDHTEKEYDVYIGREAKYNGFDLERSLFHNPFKKEVYGRQECIRLFEDYFYERIERQSSFKNAVENLKGQTLGCWCAPKDCHGDKITNYLNHSTAMDW